MASKKMKYASLASIGLMTMSLVACANPNEQYQTMGDSGLKTPQNATATTTDTEKACREYELQKDGSYKCDDNNVAGGGGGFFFFNGHTYGSHSAMVASNDYKNNNLVNGTKYKTSNDGRKNNNTKISKNNSSSKSGSKSNSGGSNGAKSSSKGFGSGGRGASGGS